MVQKAQNPVCKSKEEIELSGGQALCRERGMAVPFSLHTCSRKVIRGSGPGETPG